MNRILTTAAFIAVSLHAGPAAAQLSLVGSSSPTVIAAPVRGTDSAYDPVTGLYLVVGSYGTPRGIFVSPDGVPVGAAFAVAAPVEFAHFPRVVYSPHLANGSGGFGAFLVTWHDAPAPGATPVVKARVVSWAAPGAPGPVGSVLTVSDTTSFWEAGAPVAYSPASGVFLATWQTCCGGGSTVRARRLGIDGAGAPALLGGSFALSTGAGRDPSVAYNAATDQFGVAFSGWDSTSATMSFGLVTPAGAINFRNIFHRSAGIYITDLAVNTATGRYVTTFWDGSAGARAAEFDLSGTTLGLGLVATIVGAYDGMGLSYNAGSGTFLLVGHHPSGEVGAAELSSRGARVSAETTASNSGGVAAFYPRASSNGVRWLDTFAWSTLFNQTRVQGVLTSSTNGGGGAALPAPGGGSSSSGGGTPAPPPPPPSGGCTTPSPGTGWVCVNGGWLPPGHPDIPSGSTTPPPPPPPSGCTTPQPGPGWVCVNGGWLPPDNPSACSTPSPGSGWVCVNGGWLPPGHPDIPSGTTSTPPPPPPPSGSSLPVCPSSVGTPPASGWIYTSSGGWVPPTHPAAATGVCIGT